MMTFNLSFFRKKDGLWSREGNVPAMTYGAMKRRFQENQIEDLFNGLEAYSDGVLYRMGEAAVEDDTSVNIVMDGGRYTVRNRCNRGLREEGEYPMDRQDDMMWDLYARWGVMPIMILKMAEV